MKLCQRLAARRIELLTRFMPIVTSGLFQASPHLAPVSWGRPATWSDASDPAVKGGKVRCRTKTRIVEALQRSSAPSTFLGLCHSGIEETQNAVAAIDSRGSRIRLDVVE